jgi:NAD(P)H dehydrogenase (quinone)
MVKFNPVKVLLVISHPDTGSFTHAAAAAARAALEGLGHTVIPHDLYAEGWDPVMPASELARGISLDEGVQRHAAELESSGGLLVVHPDWWGQAPAILKGWVDRVFRPGVAYEYEGEEFREKTRIPLLTGKTGLVLCPTDSEDIRAATRLRELWEDVILGFCGMRARCVVFPGMHGASPARRRENLRRVEAAVRECFPSSRAAGTEAGAPAGAAEPTLFPGSSPLLPS